MQSATRCKTEISAVPAWETLRLGQRGRLGLQQELE
jgi:hypothetical protein